MKMGFSKTSSWSVWILVWLQVVLATAEVTPIRNYRLPSARIRDIRSKWLKIEDPDDVNGTSVFATTGSTDLQYVELPLDHFGDGSAGTFRNRYWVDDSYYQPGGPVIFFDNGEANAELSLENFELSSPADLAMRFNGLLIIWEHRFYGTSMPNISTTFTLTPQSRTDFFEYLTIEQALEDVAVFARNFAYDRYPNEDLTPGSVPWIFIGSSYAGARAAWARLRNPELWYASLAASATVQLQEDFWQYFKIVEEVMQNGYSNCSADLAAIADWMSAIVEDGNTTAIDSFMLEIAGGNDTELSDFFSYSSANYANGSEARLDLFKQNVDLLFADFQTRGIAGLLSYYCDSMHLLANDENEARNSSSDAGVVETYGLSVALRIHTRLLGEFWETYISENYGSKIPSTSRKRATDNGCDGENQVSCMANISQLSWFWQVCTEFGNFQTSNVSRQSSIVPTFFSVEGQIQDCEMVFGPGVSSGPNLQPINSRYGGWNMNATNVFFADGEFDPWRATTINSVEDNSPKRVATTTIPAAGEVPADGSHFGYVLRGGLHGSNLVYNPVLNRTVARGSVDLSFNWDEAAFAHELFVSALEVWLPAFETHSTEIRLSPEINGTLSSNSAIANGQFPSATSLSYRYWVGKKSLVAALIVAVGFVTL